MTPHRHELAPRSDGARYRRVTLVIDQNGALTLDAHQMGAGSWAAWGMDDEELTLSVAPEQVARLALALAAEILKDGQGAAQRLAQICEDYDVPCRIACWS
jgi:hypothetical protein